MKKLWNLFVSLLKKEQYNIMTGVELKNKIADYIKEDKTIDNIEFDFDNSVNQTKYCMGVYKKGINSYDLNIHSPYNMPFEQVLRDMLKICNTIIEHKTISFRSFNMIQTFVNDDVSYQCCCFKIGYNQYGK